MEFVLNIEEEVLAVGLAGFYVFLGVAAQG